MDSRPRYTGMLTILLLNLLLKTSAQTYGTSMLQYLTKQFPPKNRPKIHTFLYGETPQESFEKDELLKIWAEAWADAGWDPTILTEQDAKHHPQYQNHLTQLTNAHLPEYRWSRFLRYVAMAQQGGGWYSEPFILPLRSDLFEGKAFDLPHGGNFSMHTPLLPELMSGSRQEWDKLAFLMMVDPHGNDALILQNLIRDNPKLFHVEEAVINARYLLDAKLQFELCDLLENKYAAKFSYQIAQRAGFTRTQYYDAVTSSLKTITNKCTIPKMHTFFEAAYDNVDRLLEELEAWKKAWKDAGWRPVILTLEDAKRHPDFEKFKRAFDSAEHKTSDYDRMCFYRWLAMAASGGGWMSDYDTFPLFMDPFQDGLILPNGGKFTSYAMHVPCLISGNTKEWNRLSSLLLFSYLKHTKEFWSDMLALEEIQSLIHGTEQAREVITADEPYRNADNLRGSDGTITNPFNMKDICPETQGKRAIHFSHASCKRAGYCHENRHKSTSQWTTAWQEQCLLSKNQ